MEWIAGKSYLIAYESEGGRRSRRRIDLIRASRSRDGRVFLRAFCHLRGEERTFRADRVLAVRLLEEEASDPRVAPAAPPATAPGPAALPRPAYRSPIPLAEPEEPLPAALPRRKSLASTLVGAGFFLFLGLAYVGSGGAIPGTAYASASAKPVGGAAVPRASPAPAPRSPAVAAVEEMRIAGMLLRTIRSGSLERYEVPELGLRTLSKVEAVAAIRLPPFVAATGIADPCLIARYLEADLNGSGRLSFDELAAFQRKTYASFRYEANEQALRPELFLAAGGGDCEDFSLYSAALLRFWGWDPYLGSLGPEGSGSGHAVCLSYEEGEIPPGFEYFEVGLQRGEDAAVFKPGRYVPIDYDQVGRLSNAAKKGWKLRKIYVPEEAWGLAM